MIARGEVEPPGRSGADRSTAFVIDRGHSGQHRRETCAPRPQTKVEDLEPEEIVFIEQSADAEHVAPDEHHAAADGIDAARLAIVGGDVTGVSEMSHPPAG